MIQFDHHMEGVLENLKNRLPLQGYHFHRSPGGDYMTERLNCQPQCGSDSHAMDRRSCVFQSSGRGAEFAELVQFFLHLCGAPTDCLINDFPRGLFEMIAEVYIEN